MMMVIIWLMMVNKMVGGCPKTPLKNDGVSSSVGMMTFPTERKQKIPWFPTTNQLFV